MVCAPCAKKAAARRAALLAKNQPLQPLASGYVKKRYLGPPATIDSITELSYGYRQTGEIMIIHEDDFKANPNLWGDID